MALRLLPPLSESGEKLLQFLRSMSGLPICESCIAKRLGLEMSEALKAVRELVPHGTFVNYDQCQMCFRHDLVVALIARPEMPLP